MTSLWFKRSCQLSQDPAIRAVGLQHGAGAITVFEELIAIGKMARSKDGTVATTWALLADRALTKPREGRAIVAALEAQGVLWIDQEASGTHALVVVIDQWAKWNPKDATGAERQRRHRDRNGPRNGAVTEPAVTREERRENRDETSVATPTENAASVVAFPGGRAS